MNLPTLTNIHGVYCIGIGGVGVSAVAKYWLAQGAAVSGSDPVSSPLTFDITKAGGVHYLDIDSERLSAGIDLVIYSDACPPNHPELVAAHQHGLVCLSFADALGQIMNAYPVRAAIAGTNGKSTTTALAGLLAAGAGLDPTVLVGSRVGDFDGNLRLGRSPIFVAEADEWRDHFHALHPTVLTITNLELDHPDYFTNLDQLVGSFQAMVDRLPVDGSLIINLDDPLVKQWQNHPRAITVGQGPADFTYQIRQSGPEQQRFTASWQGKPLGDFRLHVPGAFNVANAAQAMATVLTLGASPKTFSETLEKFRGIWRRFEIVRPAEPTVILDYAHHPTAIRGTLSGAREFYPNRRIVAIFQPHLHQRLTTLFQDFAEAFAQADEVIIQEVYAVLGREQRTGMKTGVDLSAAVRQTGKTVFFAEDAKTTRRHLEGMVQPNDLLIVMGAGDIWTLAGEITASYG